MTEHNCPSPMTPEQKAEYEKFVAEHTTGKRISFTVIQRRPGADLDIRYDADRLESIFRDVDMHPMLSFVSSGKRITIPYEEVIGVEFHNLTVEIHDGKKHWGGADWCAGCDQRFGHIVKRPT